MATDDTTRPLSADLGLEERPEDAPADAAGTTTATDTTTATRAGATTAAAAPAPTGPRYRSGPAPFALVLGILGLVTAGLVLLTELTDVDVPWNDLGPWTIVAGGALVLLVGLVGLRSSRSRD
jgi:hypothetical protein